MMPTARHNIESRMRRQRVKIFRVPFSLPIECTDRDSGYVMDGVLYNESDLIIDEHYVDSHGYTEINYAGFAMIGKQLSISTHSRSAKSKALLHR